MAGYKKMLALIAAIMVPLSLSSCETGPNAELTAGTDNGTQTAENREIVMDSEFVQQPDYRDYVYMWWKNGFVNANNSEMGRPEVCIQSGYYGMNIDTKLGMITKLGWIENAPTEDEAESQDASLIEAMPSCTMNYNVNINGQDYPYAYAIQKVTGSEVNSMIIESGRYMQSMELLFLQFRGRGDILGRMEIKAMPSHFSLYFNLYSYAAIEDAELSFTMKLGEEFSSVDVYDDGYAATFKREDGKGFTFVLPKDSGAQLETDGSSITFKCVKDLAANEYQGFGAVCVPSLNASREDAVYQRDVGSAQVSAVQIEPSEGRNQDVTYDAEHGYFIISTNRMNTNRLTDFADEEARTSYDRLKFTVKNPTGQTIKVPIMFYKDGQFGVEGLTPMIRDINTGEPTGLSVQLTKNWHYLGDNYPADDPHRYLEGTWLHAYTMIEVPAYTGVEYEFTIAYAQWGQLYAASHAQLCLAGWIGRQSGQVWETSAIGSSHEAFCYDAENNCRSGFIVDIVPFGITTEGGQQYGWVNSNGGGNFLIYTDTSGEYVGFKNMKIHFRKQGPNVTEVIYTAVTSDDSIAVKMTANLGRTDDLSKALHTFEYEFLKDVEFERLAFYQIGSDFYNVVYYPTMTIGNDDGPINFTLNGQEYGAEFELDYTRETGYIGSDTMQRIEVPGTGCYIAFTGTTGEVFNDQTQSSWGQSRLVANRMLAVKEYSATLNGVTYTQPCVSLYRSYTDWANWYAPLAELSPPAAVGNTIKAGSRVSGKVEYVNLPFNKELYYIETSAVNDIPEEYFNTYKMAEYYYNTSKYSVSVSRGSLIDNLPLKIEAQEETVQFSITGGFSYIPVTITGLGDYSGYSLEYKAGDEWVKFNQSVNGNDYWQCYYDSGKGKYELSYNIPAPGATSAEYRLVKN